MRLDTPRAAKIAVLRQAPRWWGAGLYHCPICDADFATDGEAAQHLIERQHPVLRWDQAGCWEPED